MGKRSQKLEPGVIEAKTAYLQLIGELLIASAGGVPGKVAEGATSLARDSWKSLSGPDQHLASRMIVDHVLTSAGLCLGPDILGRMFNTNTPEPNTTRSLLRQWLDVTKALIEQTDQLDELRSSIDEVQFALRAIDRGEPADVFKVPKGSRKSGKKINSFTMATCQIEAIFWKESLPEFGITATEADELLKDCFGPKWDTMRKWEEPCREALGPRIGQQLHRAHRALVDTLRDRPLSEVKAVVKLLGSNYKLVLYQQQPQRSFSQDDVTAALEKTT